MRKPNYVYPTPGFPSSSRELRDIEALALTHRGNARRRAEALVFLVKMWSRVLHGELSPQGFWEVFGLPMQQPSTLPLIITSPAMHASPFSPGLSPLSDQPAGLGSEDPKVKSQRERLQRNREAAAGNWA